jgi:hypothetical protein
MRRRRLHERMPGVRASGIGADGEIRTLTDEDLNLVPLPLGYVGDGHKDREPT